MATYKVIKYFSDNRPSEDIKTALTKSEAQLVCKLPDTSGELEDGTKWFYGFTEE